jgi:hypothetical protein
MKRRLQSIRRMLAVQDQLRRLAEWKLADIDRQLAEVAAAQADLDSFVDRAHPISGMLLGVVTTQRRRLGARAVQLKEARVSQAERLLEASRSLKLAEGIEGRVDDEERRRREKAELIELIESAVHPREAGSR